MWLTWLFSVASLTTRRSAISALDRPAAIIFSGGFGGLSGLPHWLNTLISYLPAQPMIDAVTRALGGLLLSVRFFRWDPTRPRHARSAGAGNPARSV